MILLSIFATLIATTLLEFYVVIKVANAIGVLPTLGIMVLDAALGAALMRSQGRAVWRRFTQALREGRMPGREVLDGALVVAGGAFLITPGFVTDIFGALLLLPPTRAIARRLVVRHFGGRVLGAVASPWVRSGPGAGPGRRGGGDPRGRGGTWRGDASGGGGAPPGGPSGRGGAPPGGPSGRGGPPPGGPSGRGGPPPRGTRAYDIEGSAVEADREELRP